MNETKEFFDIIDTYTPPWWKTTTFIGICVLFSFFLIAGLVYWYLQYRNEKNRRAMSPHEWAHHSLKSLIIQANLDRASCKKLYVQMIDILKQYISARYGISIDMLTDDETLAYLKERNININAIETLESIINGGRLVKFAKQTTLPAQVETDRNQAYIFIDLTKAQEQDNL